MKAHKNWSYSPYKPPFFEVGDIYICRVVPYENALHFEWLNQDNLNDFEIFYRKKYTDNFILAGKTDLNEYTIKNLEYDCDYEFYVTSGNLKSRIRLARCGEGFNTTVNYLHPDDEAYEFSGRYLCSPSLIRHPEGYLLASMDVYGHHTPQNLTLIFRSDDEGTTWHYVSELFPCFWGKMFIYQNELYMLSVNTEYGDLLIGKSTDGGKTFGEPTVLLRGSNGKNGECGWHKNPQPVVKFGGRLWNTLEYGSWDRGYHAPMVMSAKIGSNLLDADNWLFSEPVKFNYDWDISAKGTTTGNIEGSLIAKNDKLYNIMRFDMSTMEPNYGYVIAYNVDTENPENPLRFDRAVEFPANHSKFIIKYNPNDKKYYSIASRITDSSQSYARNLLSLMVSEDLINWSVAKDIVDKRDEDKGKIGFQYVDFIIENNKILYLTRVGINGARSNHDSNYSSFGVLEI